jgi:hypothetical protein
MPIPGFWQFPSGFNPDIRTCNTETQTPDLSQILVEIAQILFDNFQNHSFFGKTIRFF